MKDDIKEIDRIIINVKRKLQFSSERRFVELFNKDEIHKLLDYITNLQEENDKLLKQLENISLDEATIRADILLEQQDYKTRNEKAIDKMKGIKYDLDI